MTIKNTYDRSFFTDLAVLLTGQIILPEDETYEQVPLAFGPNYERLRVLKRVYDPEDVFSSTIGHIIPAAS